MKKSSDTDRRNIQRATVRRAQQTGRRQAAASARRTASASRDSERASGTHTRGDDVSVEVSRGIRRAFVFGLIVLAAVLVVVVAVQNMTGLRTVLSTQPQATALAAMDQSITPTIRIGLVSGHRGNDSGSVCQDGLTEAQLNFDTAVRVAELLRSQGYSVDILDEFDPRLRGYQAAVLLSIHADSCTYINDLATGFKAARFVGSTIPTEEDRLVACLTSHYKETTGLHFHANTVTFDMTQYHAFREIDGHTPGAIIETGFMYLDRALLTRKPELVSQGIYEGLMCFLKGEGQQTSPGQ